MSLPDHLLDPPDDPPTAEELAEREWYREQAADWEVSDMDEHVVFTAAMKSVRFDAEGEGTVSFTVPASDMAAVVHILRLKEVALKVKVEQA